MKLTIPKNNFTEFKDAKEFAELEVKRTKRKKVIIKNTSINLYYVYEGYKKLNSIEKKIREILPKEKKNGNSLRKTL